jgi:class 3 adenylate cyclase
VIGSTVNAASRLEALTRALDCALVASDELVKRAQAELGSADGVFRPLIAQAPQTIPRGLEHPDRDLGDAVARGGVIDRGDRGRLGAFRA